ncbi:MAG: type II toxin-antitoxin system VapC family toxin [Deltaproteobacteria bacterium]|nr:type II toxin-antitoxin system VapC family toxin [Deltaproteobacteria bacterium]
MRLLLDTHILIWLAEGLADLPPRSRRRINDAARGPGLAVSAISFWEVAMLARRGRIAIRRPVHAWRADVLAAPGIREIAVSGDVGVEAVLLPGKLHEDPADRVLVATARLHGLALGTRDRRLLAYGDQGHVAAVAL